MYLYIQFGPTYQIFDHFDTIVFSVDFLFTKSSNGLKVQKLKGAGFWTLNRVFCSLNGVLGVFMSNISNK